ncbi:hypothetical protein IWZ00DRAFT_45568 [Phyllosticta capitalensis]
MNNTHRATDGNLGPDCDCSIPMIRAYVFLELGLCWCIDSPTTTSMIAPKNFLRQLPIFGQQILLPAGLFWPIGTPTRQPPKVLDRVHQYSHSCPGQPVDHASHSVPQKNCQLHGVGPKAVRVAEIIQTAKGGFACAQGVSIIGVSLVASIGLVPATSHKFKVLCVCSGSLHHRQLCPDPSNKSQVHSPPARAQGAYEHLAPQRMSKWPRAAAYAQGVFKRPTSRGLRHLSP